MTLKHIFQPRFLLFLAVTALVLRLIWGARGVLLPFGLGLAAAYLLAPVVGRVERWLPRRLRDGRGGRPVAILIVYAAGAVIMWVTFMLLVPPFLDQTFQLIAALPVQIPKAYESIHVTLDRFSQRLPADLQPVVRQYWSPESLLHMAESLAEPVKDTALATIRALTGTIGFVIGMVVVPIWLFYILNESSLVINGVLGVFPQAIRPDVEAIRVIFDRVLSGYMRGQLVIAVTLGSLMSLALVLLHVPYSLVVGFLAGALAIVPMLGTFIGTAIAVFVAWLQSPGLALQTLLAFLGIQQIDNMFISPRVQGESVKLHPALVIVVLVAGQQLIGPLGLVLSVPLAAILRDIVNYFYLRVGDDPLTPAAAMTEVGYGDAVTPVMRGEAV